MDGSLGNALTSRIEAGRTSASSAISRTASATSPIGCGRSAAPADMKGLTIRVLPSKVQARTFELLGAEPKVMDLTEALAAIKAGTLDAQENPFSNTVTYGVHNFHRFHTATNHFYLSRPISSHRPSFDAGRRRFRTSCAPRSATRSCSSAICT